MAVHFDAPSARAPQAILVCSAEADPGWSFDLVHAMVMQTLELSRLRMLGTESLESLGQYLPAAYLQGETTPGSAS